MRSRSWVAGVLVAVACSGSESASDGADSSPAYQLTASIEEVMRHVVDPASDAVWESVITEVTADGVVEHIPQTDEEWATLRSHAVTLVEATDLLLMPGRRVAAPGSRSEMPGVDLEPEQIEALLAADRSAWDAFVAALHATSLTVLEAVDARDVEGLLVAGDALDLACENCHLRYWYPSLSEPTTGR